MMPKVNKGELKKVTVDGEKINVRVQQEFQMNKQSIQMLWKIINGRERAILLEKERLIEIAKQAKIELETFK